MKYIYKFIQNKKGSIAIMFTLLLPVMMFAFFGMNNYAIYNQALQATKGGVESAIQTFSKQYFSSCVQKGNSLSSCSNSQGTASSVYAEIVKYSVEQSLLRVYPTNTPTVSVQNINVTINNNYIEVKSDFVITNISGFMMPSLTPGLTSVTYGIQTVINKNMATN